MHEINRKGASCKYLLSLKSHDRNIVKVILYSYLILKKMNERITDI